MSFFSSCYDAYHRKVGFRLAERMAGRETYSYFKELQNLDCYPQDLRKGIIEKRLANTLRRSLQSEFYNDRFSSVDIPSDYSLASDLLLKLPLTTKADIRRNPNAFVSSSCRRKPAITRTAGSTGEPLLTFSDSATSTYTSAQTFYGKSWWGIPPGSRSVNIWGHSKYLADSFSAKVKLMRRKFYDALMNRTVFPAYDLTPSKVDYFVKLVRRRNPHYLLGYSSAMHTVAQNFPRKALPSNLKAIVTTGEMLFDWQKDEIEEVLGVPVIQEYGLCEAGVIAYSCPGQSMHCFDHCVKVELLDEMNQPVEIGSIGRIVVTLLGRHEVPLVRYDTGDLAAEVDQSCPCGRPGRLIGQIQGRAYDLIRTPSGKTVPGVLFTHAMKYLNGVRRFQVVQKQLDNIEVTYESPAGIADQDIMVARKKMTDYVGSEVRISFQSMKELPCDPSGKFRWVRSEMSQNCN